jgi:ribonuclease-3
LTAKEAELAEARARLKARIQAIVGEGEAPVEIPRFDEALTHPSFANESSAADNQRLEFLGDAVLGLCVSELLGRTHPDADEGALTRMRSALVNAEALARWARAEGIGGALALGKGARSGSEREQTNVLADAVEALVASVYEAYGLEGARKLVEHVVRDPMREAAQLGSRDPKSLLQEQVQARGLSAPTYRVKGMRGPQHDPTFEIEVMIGEDVLGVGEGRSKRVAEREAALAALSARRGEGASGEEADGEEAGSDEPVSDRAEAAPSPPDSAEARDPRRTDGAR